MNINQHIGNSPDLRHSERFETERDFVGLLLGYGDVAQIRAAQAILDVTDFSDSICAQTYALICDAVDRGHEKFMLVKYVQHSLANNAALGDVKMTPTAWIGHCIANAAPSISMEGIARLIKVELLQDELVAAATAQDAGRTEEIASRLDQLKRSNIESRQGSDHIGDASRDVVEALNEALVTQKGADKGAYPGSHDLGRLFGGWKPGKLYLFAGRPGMGKSSSMLSWQLRTAMAGHGVVFFSLEMTARELVEMALCDIAWTPRRRIEYRTIANVDPTDANLPRTIKDLNEAQALFNRVPFQIIDKPGLTLNDVRSMALQQRQKLAAFGKKLEVLVIDHLGLMRAAKTYSGNKVAETEELSAGLKALAKELGLAIIALAQLNRGVEGRDDKQPTLSDLRWSGSLEQDADVVAFVYREAYYLQKEASDGATEIARKDRLEQVKNELKLIVAKHRGGPTPTLHFFCDIGCSVIRDMEVSRG